MLKNLFIYPLPNGWTLSANALSELLAKSPFRHTEGTEIASSGWVPPRENSAFAHEVGGQILLCLKMEKRSVPGSIVKSVSAERFKALEAQQGSKPSSKQKKEIKENVKQDLLPRAFPKEVSTFVWIDPSNSLLFIDTGSQSKADEVVVKLINDIGGAVKIDRLSTANEPSRAMSSWLAANEAPAGFSIDDQCELSSEESGKVRYSNHSLEAAEIRQHIVGGKTPNNLAMTFENRLSFVLTASHQSFNLRKLSLLDVVFDNACPPEGKDEQFDADFALKAGEIVVGSKAVIEVLGGVKCAEL